MLDGNIRAFLGSTNKPTIMPRTKKSKPTAPKPVLDNPLAIPKTNPVNLMPETLPNRPPATNPATNPVPSVKDRVLQYLRTIEQQNHQQYQQLKPRVDTLGQVGTWRR